LLWEAAVVLVLAAAIASREMRLAPAVVLAIVRVCVPLVYFGWYFDGQWTMLDDLSYYGDGADLVAAGLDPISALFTPDGFEQLQSLPGGQHFLYSWWNLLAQYLFGTHYYAPVLINVLLTFATAAIMARTAALLGFPRGYRVGLQIFYLLQWDVVVWSSFVNLKDCLVQLLTAAALYFVARFILRRDVRSVVWFVALGSLFCWIRFYIPLMMLLSVAAWAVWQLKDWRRFALLAAAVLPAYLLLPVLEAHSEFLAPSSIVGGSLRFAVTPLPWKVQDHYSFLVLPAALHMGFFLPAFVGVWDLWRTSPLARLYLIYMLVIVALYGVTEELQDPRHRFQIVFILAWIQFHSVWVLCTMRESARELRAMPGERLMGANAVVRPNRPLGAWS